MNADKQVRAAIRMAVETGHRYLRIALMSGQYAYVCTSVDALYKTHFNGVNIDGSFVAFPYKCIDYVNFGVQCEQAFKRLGDELKGLSRAKPTRELDLDDMEPEGRA